MLFDRRDALLTIGSAAIASPAIISARAASSAPIRIGVNLPTSGVYAQLGQEANKGIQMYLESIGGVAAGRKLELIFEDETVQVNTAVAKARKLIESDHVNVLLGGVSTPVI